MEKARDVKTGSARCEDLDSAACEQQRRKQQEHAAPPSQPAVSAPDELEGVEYPATFYRFDTVEEHGAMLAWSEPGLELPAWLSSGRKGR